MKKKLRFVTEPRNSPGTNTNTTGTSQDADGQMVSRQLFIEAIGTCLEEGRP
jgi:hypothetical protein